MTDTTNNETPATPAIAATPPEKKTTLAGMTGYRTFDTPTESTAFLAKCMDDFSDFAEQPFAMNGLNDEGEYDPAIYTDQMRVRVAVLKNVPRTINGKKEPTTIKAIVVTPVPTIAALLGLDAEAWDAIKSGPTILFVTKTLDKELNHIAVRPLRDAENLETAIEQMPRTLEGFLESGRDASGIMDTFNELYSTINKKMGEKAGIWQRAKLTKSDLKKSMESAAFALAYSPALEDRGEGKESLFVMALKFGQLLAKHKGHDTAIFDKWLATRDAQTLTSNDDDDDDDISLDDLTADMVAADEPESEGDPEPEATA